MTQLNISQMARNIDTLDERVTALEESGGGTSNYNELSNRPTLAEATLEGDVANMFDEWFGSMSRTMEEITEHFENVESDIEDNTTNINSLDERVTALEESGGGGSSHVYSTEEHEVGVWTDGSKIYEKSFDITGPFSTGYSNFNLLTGIRQYINHETVFYLNDGRNSSNYLPPTDNSYGTFSSIFVANGTMSTEIFKGANKGISHCILTVQYIKVV